MEGCGDGNGKNVTWKQLERKTGRGESQRSLGGFEAVLGFFFLIVKGQGFTGRDRQCQPEDTYSHEMQSL